MPLGGGVFRRWLGLDEVVSMEHPWWELCPHSRMRKTKFSLSLHHVRIHQDVIPPDSWVGKISCRRAWKLTSVFLSGESHGQRSLVGYGPWCHRVRHSWGDSTYTLKGTETVWEFTKKVSSINKERSSPRTELASTLVLDFPAFRTVRCKYLLFKSPSL